MTLIAQFDTDPVLSLMRDKHHAWHTPGGMHGQPPRQFPMGTPGSGLEFLQFHKDLMQQFFAWNAINHAASSADLAAWTAVPAELKLPETGWPTPGFGPNLATAEARILTNTPPFGSSDELGIHVETTIHNWIHGAVAASSVLNLPAAEKAVIASLHSVASTYFYKIHGLVQYWWDQWLHPKTHFKEIIEHKRVIKDFEHKPFFKEAMDAGPHKHFIKEKDKDKDLVEIPEFVNPLVDPEILTAFTKRIAELSLQAKVAKSPFIKPLMRPEMGKVIARRPLRSKDKR